ncbi:MAG: DUF499 domain-containing protein [Alphaproteobacteria bacterium]|jgi:hypothetical protein|nr:DUF499 domain-containing protein [Alphaproteobacteria bacterium]
MATNRERMDGLLGLIDRVGKTFLHETLKKRFGTDWRDEVRVPRSLTPMRDLDAYAVLYIIIHNWRDIFENILKMEMRDAASAALTGRNKLAHSSGPLDEHTTLRALSGGVELLKAMGAKEEVAEARQLLDALIAEMARAAAPKPAAPAEAPPAAQAAPAAPGEEAAARRPTLTLSGPRPDSAQKAGETAVPAAAPARQESFFEGGEVTGLKPWRIVCPPREDVLTGRLDKDTFAANLASVDRAAETPQDGAVDPYADPLEFFSTTYLTAGLALTLENAARRLIGDGGPSTIGLQTNFGGGKTHTLLSLYHMARLGDLGTVEALAPIEDVVGQSRLGDIAIAVFSGSDKGPDQPLAVAEGRPVRTLWGYLAWRLAGRDGLGLVEASETAGTSPGGEVFQKVLGLGDRPALILLDELVAFIRQLSGERFNAHLSFLQSLTEAAARVPRALIVGSLPESDIEVGGERGREALRILEKLFGRTQSAWQPAQGAETYSVVRRRLFQELDARGETERKRTIDAFRQYYRQHKADFPAGTGERDYADRMLEAYPVHPMLFDKLSGEWGALERFQRTRGVLALLARTIFASYRDGSTEPLILPSSLRINDPAVRGGLLEPLSSPAWGSIIESEVDGDLSLPARMEAGYQRYRADQICRRAARAVFVSTAPAGDARGGLTGPELRLACVRPGEQISVFGDALRQLAEGSAHLYTAGGRYWYGPTPTLNRLAENRQADIDDDRANDRIVAFLRADERQRGEWTRVHTAPDRAADVADEPSARLVLLGPRFVHAGGGGGGSSAEIEALDGIDRRAGGQRDFRNALIFLASDTRGRDDARRAVKRLLAWQDIVDDRSLDLKESQKHDAETRRAQAETVARELVRKSWNHLLIPIQSSADASKVALDTVGMRPSGQRSPAEAAWDKAKEAGAVAPVLGKQAFTSRLMELWPDGRDDLPVDLVRDWYFKFLHMARLRDETVLARTISEAVADLDAQGARFALAAGKADGRYEGLQAARSVPVRFGEGMLLVVRSVADRQLAPADGGTASSGPGSPGTGAGADAGPGPAAADSSSEPPGPGEPIESRPRRFNGVVELDTIRGAMKVSQVFESIIAELDRDDGTSFRIVLEIQAECPGGFSKDVADVVGDNAQALGFTQKQFSS